MANKLAKEFSENSNHDFGSFKPVDDNKMEALNEGKRTDGVSESDNNRIQNQVENSKAALDKKARSDASIQQKNTSSLSTSGAKGSVTSDSFSSSVAGSKHEKIEHEDESSDNKPLDAAKKSLKGKAVKSVGTGIKGAASKGVLPVIGSKATGALSALKGLGVGAISGIKSAFAVVGSGFAKAGTAVGAFLHTSATVGTVIVVSSSVALAGIPAAGGVGYFVNQHTQRTDGCTPEEYDEALAYSDLNPEDFVGDLQIGQACGGESGLKHQKAGDQKGGKEVCKSDHYGSNWTYVIRAKDPVMALKIADTVTKACDNDHVGYDQVFPDRKSAYAELEKVDFNVDALKVDCETTCGELANVGLRAAGVEPEYAPGPDRQHCTATSNIWANLKNSGQFEQVDVDASKALPGDILIRAGDHTAIVIRSPNRITGVTSSATHKTNMTVSTSLLTGELKIGQAASGENGLTGNKAGDGSGHEVAISSNYGSWSYAIRAKNPVKRARIAEAMRRACENDHIGYDLDQRGTCYAECEKVGWDPSKITTDCETSCSDLAMVCLRCAGIDEAYAPQYTATSRFWDDIKGSGEFEKIDAVAATAMPGDILIHINGSGSSTTGHTAVVISSPNKVSPMFGSGDYNDMVAGMTADDGCGGEMDGALADGAYIGKGMKEITAANGEKYIILDADWNQVIKLGHQGTAQCYIYSIGYCDLILGGKFRCSIDGSDTAKNNAMRSAYGSGVGENGDPGTIGGASKNLGSTDEVVKTCIEELKQGRPVIIHVAGNSYNVETGGHFVCICGWTADAGASPSWDELVCCDPAYFHGSNNDGLHAIKGFHDYNDDHNVTTFEGYKPTNGQKRRTM